jgi:tetratricopeptide (TPR) repeat protein
MRSVSTIALGVTLALGAVVAATAPAAAQRRQPVPVSEFSKEERAALLALQTALEAKNYPAATAALATAQSRARTGNARYLASALQLRLAIETGDRGLQSSAIDAMIASGAAPASELPQLYRNQAALLQQQGGKLDRAENSLTRYLELVPSDSEALLALSQIKHDRRKQPEAVALIERAIDARKATGQPVPESWYKRGLSLAVANRMQPQSLRFSRELAASYPTSQNWRDAILVYRDTSRPDAEAVLDSWRLQRAAKALAGERDYLQFAQALTAGGLPAESKAVLDEGVSAKMVSPAKATFKEMIASSAKAATAARAGLKARETAAMTAATGTAAMTAADGFLAQGNYITAANLYRTAIQKGSVDPGTANARLGIALALAGQRAEAETALRSVTGPRADLAALWLAWLGRSA